MFSRRDANNLRANTFDFLKTIHVLLICVGWFSIKQITTPLHNCCSCVDCKSPNVETPLRCLLPEWVAKQTEVGRLSRWVSLLKTRSSLTLVTTAARWYGRSCTMILSFYNLRCYHTIVKPLQNRWRNLPVTFCGNRMPRRCVVACTFAYMRGLLH